MESLRQEIEKRFGAVEILVNNAGVAPAADFLEMADKLCDEVMRVNVYGAYNCCKTFLGGHDRRPRGRINNIASTVARVAYPGIAAYATFKHASLGLARALAMETATSGVTVNAVCPEYFNTELTRGNARGRAD